MSNYETEEDLLKAANIGASGTGDLNGVLDEIEEEELLEDDED